ncbi:MAG: carboxypeptidase regulatory-like domain-containing protein [Terracidiphilus sp.]
MRPFCPTHSPAISPASWRLPAALCLLLLAAAAVAQSDPPTARSKPAASLFRIAGKVVNASTGEAVSRASVAALSESDSHTVAAAESDADGHFALEGLPAAKYQLTASRRGYRTAFFDEHAEYSTAIVTGPDQDTSGLVFELTPVAWLHGVVTGDGGDAVEDARAILFKRVHDYARSSGPAEHIIQVNSTNTDDTGAYDFDNLEPGEYYVAVSGEPWYALHRANAAGRLRAGGDSAAALDVAYPVTYYDSTTEEAAATRIVLGKGSHEEADINLHAVPALRLAVAASQRQDGSGARAELRTMAFGTEISAESTGNFDRGGRPGEQIEFSGVAPGHYQMTQGDPPRTVDFDATSSEEVDASQGVPAVQVSGVVVSALGGPPPENIYLTLAPLDAGRVRGPLTAFARKGEFTFAQAPQGSWELTAQMNGTGYPVVSIATGSRAHAGGSLTIGDKPVRLVVTVASGGTRVEGFARKAGKGKAGAMVILVPRDLSAMHSLVRRDQSDSDGSFSLRDAAPGEYTIVAIENAWELDWGLPQVIARYLPRGLPVTIPAGAGKSFRLPAPVEVQPR